MSELTDSVRTGAEQKIVTGHFASMDKRRLDTKLKCKREARKNLKLFK